MATDTEVAGVVQVVGAESDTLVPVVAVADVKAVASIAQAAVLVEAMVALVDANAVAYAKTVAVMMATADRKGASAQMPRQQGR